MINYISKDNLSKYTELLEEKLNDKIKEPLLEGQSGDVLTIDGLGNRIWKTYNEIWEDYTKEDIEEIVFSKLMLETEELLLEDGTHLWLEN